MRGKPVTMTFDIELIEKFNQLAKEKAVDRTQLIANFIEQWIKENKNESMQN